MNGVNKAILIGNLGRDPEIRYTESGTQVANFSIATNETWTDRGGEKQERVEWHNIVVFGKLAEVCEKYLAKGRQVYIEGKIQTRTWEDREGNKKHTTEIVAHQMTMLGGKSEESHEEQGEIPVDRSTKPPEEDDIPF